MNTTNRHSGDSSKPCGPRTSEPAIGSPPPGGTSSTPPLPPSAPLPPAPSLPLHLPTAPVLKALEASSLGYALVDEASRSVLWCNPAYTQHLGKEAATRTPAPLQATLDRALETGQGADLPLPEESPATGRGPVWRLLVHSLSDTERPLLLVSLVPPFAVGGSTHLAVTRDSLTGLADRGALEQRLATLPTTPSVEWPPVTILFIDLDGFKQLNDQHGHLVGDLAITAVSRRIAGVVREDDLLARYGGDEFVIVADGLRPGERLETLVQRIRRAAQEPVETEVGSLTLSASIGVAFSGEGFANPREMLAAADRRMYVDKRGSQRL